MVARFSREDVRRAERSSHTDFSAVCAFCNNRTKTADVCDSRQSGVFSFLRREEKIQTIFSCWIKAGFPVFGREKEVEKP
jgi:hypothetical protein